MTSQNQPYAEPICKQCHSGACDDRHKHDSLKSIRISRTGNLYKPTKKADYDRGYRDAITYKKDTQHGLLLQETQTVGYRGNRVTFAYYIAKLSRCNRQT